MEDIESKILQFYQLPADEQQAVRAYVQEHDKWAQLFHDVQVLNQLAEDIRVVREMPPGDEALAYYVIARYVGLEGEADAGCEIFAEIERRLDGDAALQRRLERIETRVDEALASFASEDHLERVTGYSLDGLEVESASDEVSSTPGAAEPEASQGSVSDAPDRNESALAALWERLARPLRWGGAVALVLVLTYGALVLVSTWTQEPAERLAVVDLDETEIEGYEPRVRGEGANATVDDRPADEIYLEALYRLRNAQSATLGLFPRFDDEELNTAREQLQSVVDDDQAGSFVQLEAHFFLGKALLAQNEVEDARHHFQAVAMGEGRHTEEAVDILAALEDHYPMYDEGDLE